MEVTKETSDPRDLYYGHVSVGTEAITLCEKFATYRGVLLRASADNTAPIYVGGQNVRADNSANGGLPILPRESLHVPIDDPSKLYVVSVDVGQDLAWIGV